MGALGFLHGVEIVAVDSGGATVESVSTSVICLVGTGSKGEAGKPTLVTSLSEGFRLFGPPKVGNKYYSIPLGLQGIFSQTSAVVIVIRADGDEGVGQLEVSAYDTPPASLAAAIELIGAAESMVGFRPSILCCPGYSKGKTVADALVKVAKAVRGIALMDGINNPKTALTATFSPDARLYPIEPWVRGDLAWRETEGAETKYLAEKNVLLPPSGFVAGAMARSDNERGWWYSPSNFTLFGVTELGAPLSFGLSDKDSLANKLNEKGIAAIINHKGFRLWGNRSTLASSEKSWESFLSVRRTLDVIEESILRSHLWAVDRNLTKTYFEDVSSNVNAYLRQLKTLGAIAGGVCLPDKEMNTPDSLKNGEAYFMLDLTPSYPAEHIVFRRKISDTFLAEVTK